MQRKKLLPLVLTVAYDASINYSESFDSIHPWEVIIFKYCKEHKIVVPKRLQTIKKTY